MYKILNINRKLLKPVRAEALILSQKVLIKKIKKLDNIFKFIKKKNNRSKIFDCLNMMISLQGLNNQIYNIVKKEKKRKTLINWTYPQIRLDGKYAKQYTAPIHQDKWILDQNKNGIIAWLPLNESGSSLLISEVKKIKKIKVNSYWGLESTDKIKFKKIKLSYGEMLIFDQNTVHKSVIDENRITIQLRYEEITKNFKKKSVNQIVDPKVKNFWLKKYHPNAR